MNEEIVERLESEKQLVQQTSKIYSVEKIRHSENYRGINQHPINYELLRNLYKKFYNLVSVLYKKEIIGKEFGKKPLNYDENWFNFKTIFLDFIKAGILSPINFFDSPFRRIIKEGEELVKKIKNTYPDLYDFADEILIIANEILNEKASPYIDEIRIKNLDKRINNIVLSRNFKRRKEFQDISNIVYDNIRRIFPRGVEILIDSDLRGIKIYDNLLVIGPPRYFEEHIFSTSKTLELHAMCYDFCFKEPIPIKGFIKPFKAKNDNKLFKPIIIKDEINLSELEEEKVDFNELHSLISGNNRSVEIGQDRICRLAKLANNKFVYLSNHPGLDAKQNILIEDEKGKVNNIRTQPTQVEEIEIGMYVLLRTEGSSDLRIEIANKLLGEKKDYYREMQKNWKKKLVDIIKEKGIDNVLEFLKKNGASENMTKDYVLRWANSIDNITAIAPEGNYSETVPPNFRTILLLINEEKNIEEYRKGMKSIKSANAKAQSKATEILNNAIQKTPEEELRKNLFMLGNQKFSVPGAGTQEAFRVEEISLKDTTVKSSLVDFPFELDKG